MSDPHEEHLAKIARQTAEASLDLTRDDWGWFVALNGTVVDRDAACARAEVALARCRKDMAALILAALHRGRQEVPPLPVAGGITAERLAEIKADLEQARADHDWAKKHQRHHRRLGFVGSCEMCLCFDLLAEVAFLTRLALDAEGLDSYRAGYDAGVKAGERKGFAKGATAQKAIDHEAADVRASGWDGLSGSTSARSVVHAVADAPLATLEDSSPS